MDLYYVFTPFVAWAVTGIIKVLINCFIHKRFTFDLIGYGGLPSNHSAIVSSIVSIIAFKEGINHPAFGVAITLAFIVILDAYSLRNEIGNHAREINKLNSMNSLRTRLGHNKYEIILGIILGIFSAWIVCKIL